MRLRTAEDTRVVIAQGAVLIFSELSQGEVHRFVRVILRKPDLNLLR